MAGRSRPWSWLGLLISIVTAVAVLCTVGVALIGPDHLPFIGRSGGKANLLQAAAPAGAPPAASPTGSQPAATPPASQSAPASDSSTTSGLPYGTLPSWVANTRAPNRCAGLAMGHELVTLPVQQLAQVLRTASVLNCWILWDLPWRELQPRGPKDGVNLDAFGSLPDAIQVVEHRDQSRQQQPVRLLGRLGYAPAWANRSARGCNQVHDCGPDSGHVHDYGVIAGKVAKYMKDLLGSNCFELMGWYAPNTREHFWPDPSPRRYAKMMRSASSALKRVGTQFIMGGLATNPSHVHIIRADWFLKSVYSNAGGRFWDAVGVNIGESGWRRLVAVHKVRSDRIDITELEMPPGIGPQYAGSLLNQARHLQWLGFALLKVRADAISPSLIQQLQP